MVKFIEYKKLDASKIFDLLACLPVPTNTQALTPLTLVSSIIDQLPEEFWKDPNRRILDPHSGKGTFLLYCFKKLSTYHSTEHIINNMLFAMDSDPRQILLTKTTLKLVSGIEPPKEHFLMGDSLSHEWNMKFDLVVGNPPYNTSSESDKTIAGTSGNTTLYKKFIDFSFKNRTLDGVIGLVVQRNGVKYALEKYNVSKFRCNTSKYWNYTAGYFVSIGNDDSNECIDDDIIKKVFDLTNSRPYRSAISGKFATYLDQGKYHKNSVHGSVYGLVDTPNKERDEAVFMYITGTVVEAGPKLVFKGLESLKSYTVTDLPVHVGSCCVLYFDSIEHAEKAKMMIEHNSVVKYLTKVLSEKTRGMVFRYLKDFDFSQISTGTEYPLEWGLTDEEINFIERNV